MTPLDPSWKARNAAIDRRYSMNSLRSSGIGAVVVGVALVFAIIRLHTFVVDRAAPNEIPGMAWVAMIFPALAFLLGYVNLRAYRRAANDPNYDLSRMTPQIQAPEQLNGQEQQEAGTKKKD